MNRSWPYLVVTAALLAACDGGGGSAGGGIILPPPVEPPPPPIVLPPPAANVLRVGVGQQYAKPSLALAAAKDGDIIEIVAGTYENDPLCVTRNNLTMRAIGGRVIFLAKTLPGQIRPPTNNACPDKGIVDAIGNDLTFEGIEFTGARSSSSNGAGIRSEGINLTIRNCVFHDNEIGLLTNSVATSTITIQDSEFYNSRGGPSIDQGHNIYVNAVKKLVVLNITSHDAHVGHQLKTRSRETHILSSRFYDGDTGDSSFALDISGGVAFVTGNFIQKGPNSANSNNLVVYSTSRDPVGPHSLTVTDNIFEALLPTDGHFLRILNDAAQPVPPITGRVENNTFRAKYAAVIGPNGGVFPTHYGTRPVPDLRGVANVTITSTNNTMLLVETPLPIPQPAPPSAPIVALAPGSAPVPTLSGTELLCAVFSATPCEPPTAMSTGTEP